VTTFLLPPLGDLVQHIKSALSPNTHFAVTTGDLVQRIKSAHVAATGPLTRPCLLPNQVHILNPSVVYE
jgi:hypothetical protein